MTNDHRICKSVRNSGQGSNHISTYSHWRILVLLMSAEDSDEDREIENGTLVSLFVLGI
jgi:hypothetical protein